MNPINHSNSSSFFGVSNTFDNSITTLALGALASIASIFLLPPEIGIILGGVIAFSTLTYLVATAPRIDLVYLGIFSPPRESRERNIYPCNPNQRMHTTYNTTYIATGTPLNRDWTSNDMPRSQQRTWQQPIDL